MELRAHQSIVFGKEGLKVRLFIFSEFHEDPSSARIRELTGKVFEELMRPAFEVHRDVQGFEIGRLSLTSIFRRAFCGKNVLRDLPADRQPRRFALEPFVVGEKRPVFLLQPPQMIRLFRRQTPKHQPSAVVLRLLRGIGIKGVSPPFDRKRQLQSVANNGGLHPLAFTDSGRLFFLPGARFAETGNHVPAVAFFKSMFCQ